VDTRYLRFRAALLERVRAGVFAPVLRVGPPALRAPADLEVLRALADFVALPADLAARPAVFARVGFARAVFAAALGAFAGGFAASRAGGFAASRVVGFAASRVVGFAASRVVGFAASRAAGFAAAVSGAFAAGTLAGAVVGAGAEPAAFFFGRPPLRAARAASIIASNSRFASAMSWACGVRRWRAFSFSCRYVARGVVGSIGFSR